MPRFSLSLSLSSIDLLLLLLCLIIIIIPFFFRQHDLVCERTALKSMIQVSLSLGKFTGAFLFGVLSDKYGRKLSFLLGCLIYVVSGPLVAFAGNYSMIVAGRIGLGAACSGIYNSAFVIRENVFLFFRSIDPSISRFISIIFCCFFSVRNSE